MLFILRTATAVHLFGSDVRIVLHGVTNKELVGFGFGFLHVKDPINSKFRQLLRQSQSARKELMILQPQKLGDVQFAFILAAIS